MKQIISNILNWLADRKRIAWSFSILSIISLIFLLFIFPNLNLDGTTLLDDQFSYSPDEAYQIIEEYSLQGRKIYAISALTLDVIFPIIYSLLFGVILTGLLHRLDLSENSWSRFRFLPFVLALTDIFENISISILLLRYPQKNQIIAQLASVFTSSKWLLLGLTLATILILLVLAVPRYFNRS